MGCGVDCFGIVVDGGGEGQPPRGGSIPPGRRLHVGGMDISELRCPYGGRHPVVGGQAVERFVVVLTGDPHGLAIGEAGGSREDHGSVRGVN